MAKPDLYFALKGQTLQKTLERWAKQAGYSLKWLADHDFTLEYSYRFQGNFADADGVLNQILESFKNNPFAVKATITKNNVILIQNNTYQPSALAQATQDS